ncbi:hypothetical protein [uncultured Algibacter sp.]|uniref:hypothetical protein n=1 Tax=uncultured Algibacter sp. TaxID=298659 RepID=UPI0026103994|nr:hypothetical protein [uncultured Algibacter sp.]
MKKIVLVLAIAVFSFIETGAQVEFKVVTSVESIVPNGLGRSRIISANDTKDYKEFTTTQTKEDNTRNKSKRDEIRVKGYDETKLLNFFNIGGIRFQNIAANDAIIESKINTMIEQGWELAFVTSAVESAGKGDNQGIFITRYLFKRNK